MNLKKILEETAERLESGKLAWTKHEYVIGEGGNALDHNIQADMPPCSACAIGACAIVGVQLGEIEPGSRAIDDVFDALDYFLPHEDGGRLPSTQLINFNDKYALSAKSVADRLRELAAKL